MKLLLYIVLLLSLNGFSFAEGFDQQHQVFNKLLGQFVNYDQGSSLVDYSQFNKNLKTFQAYLSSLSSVSKKDFDMFTKNQQLAFLINSYNAFTIKLIIDYDTPKSIKDISKNLKNAWQIEFVNLLERKLSLDEIEHNLIRKNFDEPRIHFAVVCAAKGCPPLLNQAFTAEKLEQQLELLTRNFLNNKERNYYDKTEKVLYLSKIFKWYEEDFTKGSSSLENYIGEYIEAPKSVNIEYLDYDWELNGH